MIDLLNRNLSFDYFKVFYMVAKQGNLTRASEKLFISQPAVTQTINKLEQVLDVKLFIRQPKGMDLTKVGKKIFEQVEQSFMNLENVFKIISEENDLTQGEIVIGSGTNIAKHLLPEPISKFLKVYPNIKFVHFDEHRKTLMNELENGEVDIAIFQNVDIDFNKFFYKKLLIEESIFFCLSSYTKKNYLTGKELEKENLIVPIREITTRDTLEKLFTENNLKLLPKFEVSGHNMVTEFAKKNLGIGFLPYYLVAEDIKKGIFKEIKTDFNLPKYEYGYVVLKEFQTSAVKKFINYLNDIASQNN